MQDLYGLESIFPKDWAIISLQASIPVQYQGWAWAELNFENLSKLPKPEQMEKHQTKVFESVNMTIKLLKLDPHKVNLLGFSQGASLSIFSGLINPEFYNTITSLCGFIPIDRVKEKIKGIDLSMVKLFMGNGIEDPVVPINLADRTYKDLKILNIEPVYKKYDSEHTISNECMHDVLSFLKTNN
jgi:phospholipase/carboxylesterase